ncbi:MAG: hypothetical protein RJQ04_13735 [Longimicrobiales bacterium]
MADTGVEGRPAAPGRMAVWAAGALLLGTALLARFVVGEPPWIDAMAQIGALIVAVGVAVEVVARSRPAAARRTAWGLSVGSLLLLGWANGAVGILGSEDNRANLVYGLVVLVAVVGAALARLRPAGMARALFATALAQATVGVVALLGGFGGSSGGALEIVTTHGAFVALFLAAAVLFRRAGAAS